MATKSARILVEVGGKNFVHTVKAEHNIMATFMEEIVETFKIDREFYIEIYDKDFDTYVVLENMNQVKNLSKLKICKTENSKTEKTMPVPTPICEPPSEPFSSSTFLGHTSKKPIKKTLPSDIEIESQKGSWHLSYELPDFPPLIEERLTNNEVLSSNYKDTIVTLLYNDMSVRSDFYPKGSQYDMVVRTLLEKYPKLTKYVGSALALTHWRRKLQNKFKNCRSKDGASNRSVLKRKHKSKLGHGRDEVDTTGSIEKRRRLNTVWDLENYLPNYDHDAGETEEINIKYREALQALANEPSPDRGHISFYLERTFTLRRHEIVNNGLGFREVVASYPFLEEKAQMTLEFSRLLGSKFVPFEEFYNALSAEFAAAEHLYSKRRKRPQPQSSMEQIIQTYSNERSSYNKCQQMEAALAVFYISLMLRETPENWIIPFSEETVDEPLIYIAKYSESDFSLRIQGRSLVPVESLAEAVYFFFASFYIFNIKYQIGFSKVLELLQRKIFKISDNLVTTPIVLSLMINLDEVKIDVLQNK